MSGTTTTNNKLWLLLGKNLVERRRNLVSTLSEILLPLCFIFLLVWLQHFDKDSTVLERDYTCPQQSAMSPTLLSSPELNQKASTRGDSFIFAVDTAGMGAGLQTIPPFLYVLALAAKTQSKIALVPEDQKSLEWFQTRFVRELDLATAPLEQDWRWQLLRKELAIFDIPFCRFAKLVEYYNSSKEVDAYVTSNEYGTGNWTLDKHHCPARPVANSKLFAAIELRHDAATDSFAYSLRMNFTAVPGTYDQIPFVDPLLVGVNPAFQDMYMLSGFLTLQLQMDRHLINQKRKPSEHGVKDFAVRSVCDSITPMLRDLGKMFPDLDTKTIQRFDCVRTFAILAMGMDLSPLTVPASYTPNQVRLAQFPTPDYADRPFYAKTEDVMSLVLLLCYQWPTSRLIRGIVHEKESRLRESLLQMGVSLFEVMMSHLLTYTMVFTTIAALITWISSYHLFSASDPSVVFAFFALFGLSVVAFGFLVSVLFDRAKTASTAGVSLFFMAYLPYMALGTSQATLQSKSILSALFAPTGFGLGAMLLAHYEAGGQGVHWSNVWTAPAANDLPFATILLHQVYTCVLYLFLGWYFNQVVQSEFGVVRKPWYFLFSPSYWLGRSTTAVAAVDTASEDAEHGAVDQSYFEPPSEEMKQLALEGRCLQTHKLRKEFPTPDGIKVAVQDLSATFYEGQICALLGPNGGGKTSLIRMLTGDVPPTSGTARLDNRDLFEHMDDLRQHLGVCPQHDVLFEDLTVGEHLALVARIKNVANVEEQITSSLEQIGMPEKRHMLSSSLSGGQKRKLSLAMALIGDSKFVFLDEPTSGMDSHSRRFVWNLLMESKAGRIIVLTTHFLDEADYLGDQILIVGNGQLKCGGSSHFLKQRYGVGYTLTVMGSKEVGEVVRRSIPEAKLLSAMGQESTFQVPFQSSASFPKVFKQFDQQAIGYGVSVTTLEEVFVKVALEGDGNWAEAESARMQTRDAQESESVESGYSKDVVRYATFGEQFAALFRKRAMYATRDRRSVCCNTLIPILLLVMGLGMLKLFPLPEPPLLQLNERDAMQISNPSQVIQVVVDSPRLAEFIPQSLLVAHNHSRTFDNNCSQDGAANSYYDAKGIKEFSTFLREDQFHSSEPRPKLRFGGIHVDRGDAQGGLVSCTIFANSSAAHSSAVYLNVLNQALLRSSQPGNPLASIQIASYPLRFTARFQQLLSTFSAISASISTIMAFSFIPASIAVYVVREREVSAKHQQLLAGTSLVAYWTSNFAFDALMFCLPWSMALGLVHLFDIPALQDVAVVVLFGCYGLAIIPFTYLSSFYFHSHSTAQNVVLLLNFITGMVLTITSFVLSLIPATVEVNKWLAYVFRMFPGFCLGNGLFNLTVNESLKTFGDGVLIKARSSMDWQVTGASIAFLLMESVAFFLLTLLVDFYSSDPFVRSKLQALFAWKPSVDDVSSSSGLQPLMLDEDVANEVERIDAGDDQQDVVVCKHLRKVWPSTGQVAVQDATFGIQRGTVFGLLGVNGSGKTSTLKMLSGEVLPTSGTATINQLDILLEQNKVRRMIGYVPQFDALLDLLTVREHLELYGKLKGLRGADLEASVVQKMRDLRLEEFALRCAGTLSGGNKRKLSVAIALIGNPLLILADEPTTGVDALNRRFLCDTLSNYSKRFGAAVVLTTHSFEEIESLATRVGILYAGQFKMLGSIQHLKSRFGKGIVFRVRLEAPTAQEVDAIVQRLTSQRLDSVPALQQACNALNAGHLAQEFTRLGSGWAILAELEREGQVHAKSLAHWFQAQTDADRFTKAFVLAKFPTATLASDHNHHNVGQQFAYRVEQLGDGVTLGDCFAMFEQAKREFKLQEYSISGTSLESIFINLAQHVKGD